VMIVFASQSFVRVSGLICKPCGEKCSS
jgi:hypothetical protein